jgi:hypothetical protein
VTTVGRNQLGVKNAKRVHSILRNMIVCVEELINASDYFLFAKTATRIRARRIAIIIIIGDIVFGGGVVSAGISLMMVLVGSE